MKPSYEVQSSIWVDIIIYIMAMYVLRIVKDLVWWDHKIALQF